MPLARLVIIGMGRDADVLAVDFGGYVGPLPSRGAPVAYRPRGGHTRV
jgi:hypothetical protein